MDALPESARDRLLSLAQRWNQPELFGTSVAAIIESLRKQVTDAALADDQRAAAAKRWIGLEDKAEVAESVLQQVNRLTPPTLAAGLVNALAKAATRTPAPPSRGIGKCAGKRHQLSSLVG